MKSAVLCGLLALAMGATIQDKLNLKAGDTTSMLHGAHLLANEQLNVNGVFLGTADMVNYLEMQEDGNLVLYVNDQERWSSRTSGISRPYLKMQSDGNLVIYDGSGSPKWSSDTYGVSGAYMEYPGYAYIGYNYFGVCSAGGDLVWSSKDGLMIIPGSISVLNNGSTLRSGMKLISPDGHTSLVMQSDGNLVVNHDGTSLWASGTTGQTGALLNMQADGNLVIYNSGAAKWASNTYGVNGPYLKLQDDTNLVVYSNNGIPSWSWRYGLLANTVSRLDSGVTLASYTFLASPNGHTILAMQSDGNLVIYHDGNANWSTGTYGNPGAKVIMQPDGNLVVYLGTKALWATATDGKNGAFLRLQDDQNLVVYDKNGSTPYWSPSTGRRY